MFHWIVRWWRSNIDDGIVHGHDEGHPCNSKCVTTQEWKAEQRALRAANFGKHRR
jgi:hypothetical protein